MPKTSLGDDFLHVFGRRLRSRRVDLDLTQEVVAERSGLHFTYVSSVERGERNITLRTLVRLAYALDCDAGDLVTDLLPDLK